MKAKTNLCVALLGVLSLCSLIHVSESGSGNQDDGATSVKLTLIPNRRTIQLKEAAFLICKAESDVKWFFNGAQLNLNLPPVNVKAYQPNILIINPVLASHQGNYTCKADSKSDSVRLNVAPPAKTKENGCIRIISKNKNWHVGTKTRHLTCQPKYRKSQITWTKDGENLLSGRLSRKYSGSSRPSKLQIIGTKVSDSGMYTCTVKSHRCEETAHIWVKVKDTSFTDMSTCGRTDQTLQKIQGFQDTTVTTDRLALPKSAPWHASLYSEVLGIFCGGTLLNKRWIITAAHCLESSASTPSGAKVILGEINQASSEVTGHKHDVEWARRHPEFRGDTFNKDGSYNNDVAMIKLSQEVEFNSNVLPVCLGDPMFLHETFHEVGGFGTLAGFGKTDVSQSKVSTHLQEVHLPILHQDTCHNSTLRKVTSNMFCAGYDTPVTKEQCQGDSGGPYVMSHDGKWYLVGVASWSESCGGDGYYGFYAKVSSLYSWIVKTMEENL